jgi:phosphoribosylanthranilate isomerase
MKGDIACGYVPFHSQKHNYYMRIAIVTLTGADESVKPEDVFQINKDYPDLNVEWGLLLSKSNEGKQRRYPSRRWMEEFCAQAPDSVSIAGHIQGRWLKDMAEGNLTLPAERALIWGRLNRVQLNFHSVPAHIDTTLLMQLGGHNKQFIIQMDGINDAIFVRGLFANLNVAPLFDKSAGQGLLPDQWPVPMPVKFNGYAGGLGPDNIEEELKRIDAVAGEEIVWIDMETKIRGAEDNFDLDKCRRVLDVVREYVNSHH